MLAHVDGPTPTGTIGVAFGSALTPWFELAARLDVAPLASVSAHDASATVQLGRVGARALATTSPLDELQLVGGLELDLVLAVAEGDPRLAPWSHLTWGVAAAIGGTLGARLRTEHLGVELAVGAGALVPPIDITFFGDTVAAVGRPLLTARVGVFVPL